MVLKFHPKQFLSVFLMLSFVWVFVGCVFICSEDETCAEDSGVSSENFTNYNQPSNKDSCPIEVSIKMTAPDRIGLKLEFSAVSVISFRNFSATAILPDSFKYQKKFYRPPNIISQAKHPFVLRI